MPRQALSRLHFIEFMIGVCFINFMKSNPGPSAKVQITWNLARVTKFR
jgi:hypothetical protein